MLLVEGDDGGCLAAGCFSVEGGLPNELVGLEGLDADDAVLRAVSTQHEEQWWLRRGFSRTRLLQWSHESFKEEESNFQLKAKKALERELDPDDIVRLLHEAGEKGFGPEATEEVREFLSKGEQEEQGEKEARDKDGKLEELERQVDGLRLHASKLKEEAAANASVFTQSSQELKAMLSAAEARERTLIGETESLRQTVTKLEDVTADLQAQVADLQSNLQEATDRLAVGAEAYAATTESLKTELAAIETKAAELAVGKDEAARGWAEAQASLLELQRKTSREDQQRKQRPEMIKVLAIVVVVLCIVILAWKRRHRTAVARRDSVAVGVSGDEGETTAQTSTSSSGGREDERQAIVEKEKEEEQATVTAASTGLSGEPEVAESARAAPRSLVGVLREEGPSVGSSPPASVRDVGDGERKSPRPAVVTATSDKHQVPSEKPATGGTNPEVLDGVREELPLASVPQAAREEKKAAGRKTSAVGSGTIGGAGILEQVGGVADSSASVAVEAGGGRGGGEKQVVAANGAGGSVEESGSGKKEEEKKEEAEERTGKPATGGELLPEDKASGRATALSATTAACGAPAQARESPRGRCTKASGGKDASSRPSGQGGGQSFPSPCGADAAGPSTQAAETLRQRASGASGGVASGGGRGGRWWGFGGMKAAAQAALGFGSERIGGGLQAGGAGDGGGEGLRGESRGAELTAGGVGAAERSGKARGAAAAVAGGRGRRSAKQQTPGGAVATPSGRGGNSEGAMAGGAGAARWRAAAAAAAASDDGGARLGGTEGEGESQHGNGGVPQASSENGSWSEQRPRDEPGVESEERGQQLGTLAGKMSPDEQEIGQQQRGSEERAGERLGRPAAPFAGTPSSATGGGTSWEGHVSDLKLDFSDSGDFSEEIAPTVEGVESQGRHILVKIRGDGNCFYASTTTGVLLWAVSQPGSGAIEGVLRRFRGVISHSGRTAYLDLSEERQGYVKTFLEFVESLLAEKKDKETRHETAAAGALAGEVVRRLSDPGQGEETNGGSGEGAVPLFARLYRGMVIVSRIAAFSIPPHCDKKTEFLSILRKVSESVDEDSLALRPGENLGVHLGLITEYLDPRGILQRDVLEAVIPDNASRLKCGYELADATLPNATDVYVRLGTKVEHFDLRVRADSPAGLAIAREFRVEPLSDDAGEAKILEGLHHEYDSLTEQDSESDDDESCGTSKRRRQAKAEQKKKAKNKTQSKKKKKSKAKRKKK
eukprot:g5137.t1